MIELIQTDLPEPVEPAISRWGIFVRSATTGFPLTSLPRTTGISAFESAQARDSTISLMQTGAAVLFGISIPTQSFPGTGARIRTDSDLSAIAMFLSKPKIFSTLTPGAG